MPRGAINTAAERAAAKKQIRLLAHAVESTDEMISITDANNRFTFVNRAFLEGYGYRLEDVLGQSPGMLRSAAMNAGVDEEIYRKTVGGGWEGELVNRRSDGTEFPVWLHTSPIRDEHGAILGLMGIARDISDRKAFEEKLYAALQEKETLLKEIHHRVKNNMQVISSMLHLQAESISDPELARFFIESQNRVKTMAMIHEKLYQSKDLARINFGDYLRTLMISLVRSYGMGNVRPVIEAEEILLGVNVAIPCGLIVNELVSNTLKHAFPAGMTGSIRVRLAQAPAGALVLSVSDDGVGLPEEMDPATADTLGLKLVGILVQQLSGTMSVQRGRGTTFTITFPQE
ncbi:MAG: sensor histidine kinase [Acidobacteriota bacterium]